MGRFTLTISHRRTISSRLGSPARAVIERRAIHIDDIAKHADEYPVAAALALKRQVARIGARCFGGRTLVMPLMREGEAVGVIGLRRSEPMAVLGGPDPVLQTFADQAVIAIENVRLFDEVQARTKDLHGSAAAADGDRRNPQRISRSASDVQPVFER